MPTYETPEPISVELDIPVGDVRVTASDRFDTSVDVRPSDPGYELDVRSAAQTRVEFVDGRLQVIAPKGRAGGLLGKPGSVDVTIELPAGSRVRADAQVAAIRAAGRLGECRIRTGAGDVQLNHTGPLDLHTGAGAVLVDSVLGHAEVDSGAGRIRLGDVDGTAVVKNSNGDTWIGRISGELRANGASGTIRVDRAEADVTANTASGDVRIGALVRGSASLSVGFGEVEVGIDPGSAAKLDVHTKFGRVVNELDEVAAPAASDEVVSIRARAGYGDIVIRRARSYE